MSRTIDKIASRTRRNLVLDNGALRAQNYRLRKRIENMRREYRRMVVAAKKAVEKTKYVSCVMGSAGATTGATGISLCPAGIVDPFAGGAFQTIDAEECAYFGA